MTQAIGARGLLSIQKESTYNQAPAVADMKKVYFESESLGKSLQLIESAVLRGNRNSTKPVRGNADISGNFATELGAYPAELFLGVLGSVVTTGTGPYTHTMKVGDTLPSWTIEKGFPDISQYFLYTGCKFGKLSMDVSSSGFQKVTIDVMGATETPSASPYDASPTDLGKMSFDGFTISTIEEGGAPIANVVSISGLTFDNMVDGDTYVIGGGGNRGSINEGIFKVSGTLTVLFENMALYNKAINSTETSLHIVYSVGDGLGSDGNESIDILIPEMVYSVKTPAINGPKGVLVELPFQAYFDDSSEATAVQVIIKNTQASI